MRETLMKKVACFACHMIGAEWRVRQGMVYPQ